MLLATSIRKPLSLTCAVKIKSSEARPLGANSPLMKACYKATRHVSNKPVGRRLINGSDGDVFNDTRRRSFNQLVECLSSLRECCRRNRPTNNRIDVVL